MRRDYTQERKLKKRVPWNKGLTKYIDKRVEKYGIKSGLSRLGKPTWNNGRRDLPKHTEKHKKLLSKIAKERGFGKWMKGKIEPLIVRNKISNTFKSSDRLMSIARNNGINTSLKVRKGIETDIEKATRIILEELSISYLPQKPLMKITVVDFFVEPNKVIYVDGDYWHNKPAKIGNDKGITNYLIRCGYDVLRIKGSELKNKQLVVNKIKNFLKT